MFVGRLAVAFGLLSASDAFSGPRAAADVSASFDVFATRFGKTYPDASSRRAAKACWEENVVKAKAFTTEHVLHGENKYSDMCAKEFKQKMMGYKPGKPNPMRTLWKSTTL